MINIMKKHKEVILYLIFGVLTTVINIAVYALCTRLFSFDVYVSNAIAWILAVLFAYFTNRKYVFESKIKTFNDKLKEVISFYGYRLLTFAVDMGLMYALVDMIHINDMISKVVVNVIVIILNYIFSKFLIFNK